MAGPIVMEHAQFATARQCQEIRAAISVNITGGEADDVTGAAYTDRPMLRERHTNPPARHNPDVGSAIPVEIDSNARRHPGAVLGEVL